MATARLQKLLLVLGMVVSIAAILWWGAVNELLAQQTGGRMLEAVSCLYSLSASCNLLRGIAFYDPLVCWMGLVLIGVAFGFKRSLVKDAVGGR